MKNRGLVFASVSLILVLLVLTAGQLLGQVSGRGEVRGVVRDPNQAVIPGADVTIVNDNTNVTQSTITSEVGAYFIGAVQAGPYTMKVEMPGFNTWSRRQGSCAHRARKRAGARPGCRDRLYSLGVGYGAGFVAGWRDARCFGGRSASSISISRSAAPCYCGSRRADT